MPTAVQAGTERVSKPCGCPQSGQGSTHRPWLHCVRQGWWRNWGPLLREGPPPGKSCSRCLAASTMHTTGRHCPGSGGQACCLSWGLSLAQADVWQRWVGCSQLQVGICSRLQSKREACCLHLCWGHETGSMQLHNCPGQQSKVLQHFPSQAGCAVDNARQTQSGAELLA